MTAEKKAEDLLMDMRLKIFDNVITETDVTEAAKQCAIICVEEIIRRLDKLLVASGYVSEGDRICQQIKEETEVLNYLKSKQ